MKLRIDTETAERLELVRKDQGLHSIDDALVLVTELATKNLWPELLAERAKQARAHADALRKEAKQDSRKEAAATEAERVADVRERQAKDAAPSKKK